MIKQWTNDKGVKYLFVEVPKDSIQHQVYMGCLVYKEPNYENWATDEEIENPIKCQEYLDRTEGKEQYKDAAINLKCEAKLIGITQFMFGDDWEKVLNCDDAKSKAFSLLFDLGFENSHNNIAVLEVTG